MAKQQQESESKKGRPTKYTKAMDDKAFKLALLGCTDKELADILDISEATLNNWKRDHSSFLESIQRGKEPADAEIAASLFHRGKGYSHPDTHVCVLDGKITLTPIVKHYAPDTAAAFIWLKNRRSGKWRDRQEVATSVTGDVTVTIKREGN